MLFVWLFFIYFNLFFAESAQKVLIMKKALAANAMVCDVFYLLD